MEAQREAMLAQIKELKRKVEASGQRMVITSAQQKELIARTGVDPVKLGFDVQDTLPEDAFLVCTRCASQQVDLENAVRGVH